MDKSELRKQPSGLTIGEVYDLMFEVGHTEYERSNHVPQSIIDKVKAFDPKGILFHYESNWTDFPPAMWRADAWELQWPKIKADKERQIEQRHYWNLKRDAVEKLVGAIQNFSGIARDAAEFLAKAIIEHKDAKKAAIFDIDLTTEEWRKLIE